MREGGARRRGGERGRGEERGWRRQRGKKKLKLGEMGKKKGKGSDIFVSLIARTFCPLYKSKCPRYRSNALFP